MSCPMDYEAARQWFIDLWNYSIIPYLIEAIRDCTANNLQPQVSHLATYRRTPTCVVTSFS